jgi:hypothetical protein
MNEINRRALLGAAGVASAGLALAGCSETCEADGNGSIGNETGQLGSHGDCKIYGDPVNSGYDKPFQAKELCVVYIQFDKSPGPNIIQGYILLTGSPDDTEIEKIAQAALQQLATGQGSVAFYETRYNFDRFSFRAPTRIVLFIDNPDTEVRFGSDLLPPQVDLEHVVRFTPVTGLSANPGVAPSFKDATPNQNFYALKRLAIANLTGKVAYSLNYLNVNTDGSQITGIPYTNYMRWWRHSINIHLLVAPKHVGGPAWIPLVLDPDTGNMGSNP